MYRTTTHIYRCHTGFNGVFKIRTNLLRRNRHDFHSELPMGEAMFGDGGPRAGGNNDLLAGCPGATGDQCDQPKLNLSIRAAADECEIVWPDHTEHYHFLTKEINKILRRQFLVTIIISTSYSSQMDNTPFEGSGTFRSDERTVSLCARKARVASWCRPTRACASGTRRTACPAVYPASYASTPRRVSTLRKKGPTSRRRKAWRAAFPSSP